MKTAYWLLFFLLVLIGLDLSRVFYLNIFTHSLPYGIYMRINALPARGDLAATCLTSQIAQYGITRGYLERGVCPTGSVLVLKVIKAVPGDRFERGRDILFLNGEPYPILQEDSSGRVLKEFYNTHHGVVPPGSYFLLSDFVRNSWDSRYWGPVSVEFLLKPLWIFEHVQYL